MNSQSPISSKDKSGARSISSVLQQLIDDLPEEIALLDQQFTMVAVNRVWREVCEKSGNTDALPGCNYRDVVDKRAAEGYEAAALARNAFDEVVSGVRDFWQITYNGGVRWNGRDYQFAIHRIDQGGETMIMVTRIDLTELLELRRLKSDYGTSLVQGQALERQRVARELHDSTSQLLASMGLILGRLKLDSPDPKTLSLVDEMQGLLGEAHQEIRLISYLAQPPAIEKMGLMGALTALVLGFGRRTGIKASFDIVGEPMSVSPTEETTLYRIAQEALSNVHWHARAKRVRLELCFRHSAAHLVIADNGVGIPRKTLAGQGTAGVGLASMRSRLKELGGRLTIRRLSPGTSIVATLRTAAGP